MSVLENDWTTDFLRYLFKMGASKTKTKGSEGYGPSQICLQNEGRESTLFPKALVCYAVLCPNVILLGHVAPPSLWPRA